MNWLTSDLHFGHINICAYTGRPYTDTEVMNDALVERWNSIVQDDDEVWVIGDLAMGRKQISLTWASKLQGTKYLVPGNHDAMFGKQGQKYADTCKMYEDVGFTLIDVPHPQELPLTLTLGPDCLVVVNHFPYHGESVEGHEDRYSECRPIDNGGKLIHGHTHGAWRKRGNMIDVGVDAWGGYPISFARVAYAFDTEGDLEPLPWL